MNSSPTPRYRVTVHELHEGKTTKVIDAYASGFITAVVTLDDDTMDVHLGQGGPRHLQQHIAAAIAHPHPAPTTALTHYLWTCSSSLGSHDPPPPSLHSQRQGLKTPKISDTKSDAKQ